MIWRWLASRTVRRASDLHRHVRRLLRAQHDLLEPAARDEVSTALQALRAAWTGQSSKPELREAMRAVEASATRWLRDPSKSLLRESIEMLLVALVVVMALRTFFVQPMKIPTGSMQPTLYGVTTEDLRSHKDFHPPRGLARWAEKWFRGRTYFHIVAVTAGKLNRIEPPEPIIPLLKNLPILRKQRFQVGQTWFTLWFPPTDLPNPFGANQDHLLFFYGGVDPERVYRPGEEVIKLVVVDGDHVLVDRLTYNFRRPRRGEIVVFETTGIAALQQGTHYIKRLVGLGEERVRIADDRHLVINGQRLDETTPHFENVYKFSGPPLDSHYSGHLNDEIAIRYRQPPGALAPLFPRETKEFRVRPRHYLVLGDNTLNSFDGRRWGDFPQEHVIGRFVLVYWPLSERFGWCQE